MKMPKILVIDDEQGIRDLFFSALTGKADKVLTASTGKDGLAMVTEERPDLVLLDVKLPDMDGVEVLRRIKESDKDIVVIMITGFGTMKTAIETMKLGAYDYIIKPVKVDQTLHIVREGLEKRLLVLENRRLIKNLAQANKKLARKKHELEQKVVVTKSRLTKTSTKLQQAYEELTQVYTATLEKPLGLFGRIKELYSKYTSWLVVPALVLGILGAKFSPVVMKMTDTVMSKIIDSILALAPIAIFIVLAPSVAKILKTRKEGKFAGFIVLWFSITRIIAAIWAAIFVSMVLGLPFAPTGGAGGIGALLLENLRLLGNMLVSTTFFRAMWFSVAIGILAYYNKRLYGFLQKGAQAIESAGEYIEPWIPLFAFMIGGFIYGLPKTLLEEIPADVLANLSQGVTLAGININLQHEFGLVGVYFIEAALIGLGCFIWQAVEIIVIKKFVQGFSIKEFFVKYWIKVYPLAWSTASEAVSMPLNLSLIKRQYKNVHETVRRLVVGLGGYLNINGTSMDVMMLTGVVSVIVGHPASFIALLVSVPIIALIGYGVPGIAGEEILFVVPMMKIVGIPEPVIGAFLAIFCAIQMGLPDSFRTGANVTDNGIYAIALNKVYRSRFQKQEEGKRGR